MPWHALRSASKSKSQFSFVGCFSWKCQDSGQSCTGLFVAARFPQIVQCFRETLWTRRRQGPFRYCQEIFRFIKLSPSLYIPAHLPHFACTQICIWPNYFSTTGKVFFFLWCMLHRITLMWSWQPRVWLVECLSLQCISNRISRGIWGLMYCNRTTEAVWFVMDIVPNISRMHYKIEKLW